MKTFDLDHWEREERMVAITEIKGGGGGVHRVVEQLACDVEVLVEGGGACGDELLLDVWRHLGQEVLPPGG